VVTFQAVPTEVVGLARVAAVRRGDVVDLLELVLTDVADPEVAGRAVEREAPRVAQAVRPDRRIGVGSVDERVVGRDRVARRSRRGVGREAQDLAQRRLE